MNSQLVPACFLLRPQLLTRVYAPSIWRGNFPSSLGSMLVLPRFPLDAISGRSPITAEATTNRSLRPLRVEGRTWWIRMIGRLIWPHAPAVRL
jgi:hypothetical protein